MKRQTKFPDSITIVTGAPRSLTSATSQQIVSAGTFFGDTKPGNLANPDGYFEQAVFETAFFAYMLRIGSTSRGIFPLPPEDVFSHPVIPDLKNQFETLMLRDGYTGGPVGFKNVRMAFIWKRVDEAFGGKVKWVFVRRDRRGTIGSMSKTGMGGHSQSQSAKHYLLDFYDRRAAEMKEHLGDRYREIETENIFNSTLDDDGGDLTPLKEMIEWLGLTWDEKKSRSLIHPEWSIGDYSN